MPETRHHVYYRVVGPDHIRGLAVWSAVRVRRPALTMIAGSRFRAIVYRGVHPLCTRRRAEGSRRPSGAWWNAAMPDVVHFFTAGGALCGSSPSALRLTLVGRSVTCPACAEALQKKERDGLERPRALGRIRLSGSK